MEAVRFETTGTQQRRSLEAYEVDLLTPREVEVLRLIAEGLTSKEIATQLNISFKTVACHRYRILQKLSTASTISAVRWAIRNGLIEP